MKKWGAKGVHRGSTGGPNLTFSMFVFIIHSFIHLIHHNFPILLVCEECWVFVGGNVL